VLNFLGILFTAELLKYNIYFGGVKVGQAFLDFKSISDTLSTATLVVRTTGIFEKLFPVYDSISSNFHGRKFYTLSYTRFVKEGDYRDVSVALHTPDSVFYGEKARFYVGKRTMDPLSLLFYLRSRTSLDTLYHVDIHVTKKTFSVPVKVEKVKMGKGDFFKVYVDLRDPKLSKTSGEVIYFLRDDSLRTPYIMQFFSKYGILEARLK